MPYIDHMVYILATEEENINRNRKMKKRNESNIRNEANKNY